MIPNFEIFGRLFFDSISFLSSNQEQNDIPNENRMIFGNVMTA